MISGLFIHSTRVSCFPLASQINDEDKHGFKEFKKYFRMCFDNSNLFLTSNEMQKNSLVILMLLTLFQMKKKI